MSRPWHGIQERVSRFKLATSNAHPEALPFIFILSQLGYPAQGVQWLAATALDKVVSDAPTALMVGSSLAVTAATKMGGWLFSRHVLERKGWTADPITTGAYAVLGSANKAIGFATLYYLALEFTNAANWAKWAEATARQDWNVVLTNHIAHEVVGFALITLPNLLILTGKTDFAVEVSAKVFQYAKKIIAALQDPKRERRSVNGIPERIQVKASSSPVVELPQVGSNVLYASSQNGD